MSAVTDLDLESPTLQADPASDLAAGASRQAAIAAAAAGVVVREVTELDQLTAVESLYDTIWRPDGSAPIGLELLRALSKAGNYVAGAYDGDLLVGACVAFFAGPSGAALHSHIAGVAASAMGRNVGFALKLHQRAWAMARGIGIIEWTFDPLVSRNAYFNVCKLAGRPIDYLPNFYGGMNDGINGRDDTDRLLLRWNLIAADVSDACSGRWHRVDADALRSSGAVVALGRTDAGLPVTGRTDAAIVLVAVPLDIESLRLSDPAVAREWRLRVRDTLGGLIATGGRVLGFDRAGWYVVEQASPSNEVEKA